jgi:hypothetical protein
MAVMEYTSSTPNVPTRLGGLTLRTWKGEGLNSIAWDYIKKWGLLLNVLYVRIKISLRASPC